MFFFFKWGGDGISQSHFYRVNCPPKFAIFVCLSVSERLGSVGISFSRATDIGGKYTAANCEHDLVRKESMLLVDLATGEINIFKLKLLHIPKITLTIVQNSQSNVKMGNLLQVELKRQNHNWRQYMQKIYSKRDYSAQRRQWLEACVGEHWIVSVVTKNHHRKTNKWSLFWSVNISYKVELFQIRMYQ